VVEKIGAVEEWSSYERMGSGTIGQQWRTFAVVETGEEQKSGAAVKGSGRSSSVAKWWVSHRVGGCV